MTKYIVQRILSLIPILLVVAVVVFMLIHLTPGDPASVILGDEASEEAVAQLRAQLGLDLPLYQQFISWFGGVVTGDLGESIFMDMSVAEAFFSRVPPTLSLAILAQIFAVIIALFLGIIAARKRGTLADQAVMGFSLLGISVPSFLLGLFLILFFAVKLQWLPVAGYQPLSSGLWNHLRYLLLPAIALGAMQAALIARMTRSSIIEVLSEQYIKTARAKGLKERIVVYKHALKNAFIPILTVIGETFGTLITGASVIETVFNVPGIGQLIIRSIERRDFAVIQGSILLITVTYVLLNLLIDLLYGLLDPRVKLNRR
ncbi:ABC transporter permease [Paenibacillus sp. FSL H8-0457]|uniref:ABC transporter permease n=1 Tax=Bacillales TaxID=1385 RepID=UPI0001B9EC9D|nr:MULTISPECIES: ABC transporter permease [Paenibacillus]ACX63591.1 binding-protein-dependent transport systems inner membrane component [Paenibacillus sp. Y412MC10]ETT64645.1 binding-protein-dependent transport systems inner membrane component [Paenibacillus sp. FSL H8-457]MCM3260408.1 ABC transporter permease [Paenibacillus lautus]